MSRSFYIIDGHAQIFRAYYARMPALNAPNGEPTKATFVFFQMLLSLLRDRRPDHLAVALDSGAEHVFRRELDPDYKANREPPPEDFAPQAQRIIELIRLMNIPAFEQVGFEADDLMASLCARLESTDVEVYLVSRDKDLEQLISDRVYLFDPFKNEVIDRTVLEAAKGYAPEQAVEIQTLTGDSTDNVPGVPGIGPKTAAKLIARFGTAEGVLEHAEELTPKQRENVRAFSGQMPLTRKLVTLRRDVVLDFDLERCAVRKLGLDQARPLLEELGFVRLLPQLDALARRDPSDGEGGPAVVDAAGEEGSAGPETRYHLVDTPEALSRFVEALSSQDVFAFDTETTGLNPVAAELVGMSFCWQGGEAYYLPVRSTTGRVLELDRVLEALDPIFEDPHRRKVGQNLKYDLAVLRQVGISVSGVYFDTLIASFLLDPLRHSHGLDALAWELCGHRMIPISDLIGKGRNQCSIDEVAPERVCEYACEDADYTWRIYEQLRPRIEDGPFAILFRDTEMPLVEVLCEMECNGVVVDTDLLANLSRRLTERLEALTGEIHAAAGHGFNIDSTQQLAVVLFDELHLPVGRKTKTGRSTDAETLRTLAHQTNHALPKLVLEYRELTKLKSTYIDTLPKMVCARTGRIHAGFHQTGAVTGRLSSSGPNLQNIPVRTEIGRQIRGAFIAGRPGYVLLTADYSQIELRVLAHYCQDATLLEAFRSGQDIHTFVAAQVHGIATPEVTREQRSAAKAVNFGIIYGQSAFGLARSLDIARAEAQSFIDMYFMRYPGIRLFIDQTIEDARRRGYVETLLGRRRPLPELLATGGPQAALGKRLAVNTVIQGSAADLIKRAMVDIHREIEQGGHPSRVLIQVHDELVFEMPAEAVEEEAEMIRAKMTGALPLAVPLAVDIAWGRNWLESK